MSDVLVMVDPGVVAAHLQSAAGVRIYPKQGPWGRALAWWQRAAELAPALPLGLAADLGALLSGQPWAWREDASDAYALFLRDVALTPAVRTAQGLGLNDLAIAALLAHSAQQAAVPPTYHLPPTVSPAAIAQLLQEQLPPVALASETSFVPHPACVALTPADVRFLHAMAGEALGVADLADLRGLSEMLGLPAFRHILLDEVLAFAPALADLHPGTSLQTYTADGYGGLARRGSFDAVLPSEWALPDVLLTYRLLNGELLYYGHERPPERRTTLLLLLVQLGDAMAGDLELLAKASALALGRAALTHGVMVRLLAFDRALYPPQGLGRSADVAALVRQTGQGVVDLQRVLEQVHTHVYAQASGYAQVELIWFLHAQTGGDHLPAVAMLARQLRSLARSRALFLSMGQALARPMLAGVLADQWTSVGSVALYDAEERARAARALRDLATPRRTERAAEAPASAPRRVVGGAAARLDPAQALLERGEWDSALDQLEPRARAGDAAARQLLVTLLEGVAAWDAGGPALRLRLRVAEMFAALGDPRLLDISTGDAPIGRYWCTIPAGRFWFGDEQQGGLRQQSLPYAFRVGRYLVTNAEYRRFIEAGGYQHREWWTANGWPYLQASENRFKSNGRQITHPWYWFDPVYNQPNQPVVGISWWEALAYCRWLTAQGRAAGWLTNGASIRLPTSLEWERVARGETQQRYPWGDAAPDSERANYAENQLGRPTPVGLFPQGAAPCGAHDMAGNTMEWLATRDDEADRLAALDDVEPDAIVLLSHAAFDDDGPALRCGGRIENGPFARYLDRGFRVVIIGE